MNKMIYQWIIIAKNEGICDSTGNKINIGDEILYIPKSNIYKAQVYCKDSNNYKRATSMDEYHMTGYKN